MQMNGKRSVWNSEATLVGLQPANCIIMSVTLPRQHSLYLSTCLGLVLISAAAATPVWAKFVVINGFIQWQVAMIQSRMFSVAVSFPCARHTFPFIFYSAHVWNVRVIQPKVGRKCKHLTGTCAHAPSLAASPLLAASPKGQRRSENISNVLMSTAAPNEN